MRSRSLALVCAVLFSLLAAQAAIHAQQPEQPASQPELVAPPPSISNQRPPAIAPPRSATASALPSLAKADPNSPGQAGRNALYQYLDDIAAKDEAVRRAEIAKITTRQQALERQQKVRAHIVDLLGGGFQTTPLNARITGSTQMDGFRIEKVLFDSQPNFPVTALLYLPDAKPGAPFATASSSRVGTKLPAIVMAPGHASSGKAGDYAFAAAFARNGFAVLSYDPIGQGERLQYPDPAKANAMQPGDPYPGASFATRSTGEHGEAGLQPTLIGDAVARYFLWDGMRAVDYLLTRPEIDPARIGAFGCSGGGAMTALLGGLDKRIAATATACYITSMDTLLPSIGPQDAEQSIPGWIASGPGSETDLPLDFADWVELAAPRPYAIVGTTGDMFPWKGLLASAQEARRFYAIFDAKAEGTPSGKPLPPTPTGPTLNPDTPNAIAPDAPLQVIAGIGGHGNLKPLMSQIISFFLVNLAHSNAQPILPPDSGAPRSAATSPTVGIPAGALQVTATGQVATSYPGCATVHSLNLKRAAEKIPQFTAPLTQQQVQTAIREVTSAEAVPGPFCEDCDGAFGHFTGLPFPHVDPARVTRGPALLVLMSDQVGTPGNPTKADIEKLTGPWPGRLVVGFVPRPSPPGGEETKSPILGPFYMTELRAEIVGKTLLGMRVDDVIHAVDYLASRADVDPHNITVMASGHMGLVALHAAALDSRIQHITIDHVLRSYRSLIEAPMPLDAPQDILPGVLLHYDIPDVVRVLGDRVTATDWLPGTANLALPTAAP